MHIKLDELIRSVKDARNTLIDSEEMTRDRLRKIYARLAARERNDKES